MTAMSAIGAIGSYGSMGGYYSIGLYHNTLQNRASSPASTEPVERVSRGQVAPVPPVSQVAAVHRGVSQLPQEENQFPTMREGADPAEMAVRSRIRYLDGEAEELENELLGWNQSNGLERLLKGEETEDAAQLPWEKDEADSQKDEDSKSPREVMEESECQTCKNRKYQDGSDDPGVSFKTATNVAPEQAASAVRGHEQEHVVREQAKAKREDRRVVNQSVTIHTAICPECGDVYVSGGTTRTTTRANPTQESQPEDAKQNSAFEAIA